jgi:DNA/RNA-binding domain of Phe-tRNA-synthetase-like protein
VNFHHSSDIWQEFPDLVPGVFTATGIDGAPDGTPALDPWYERARDRLQECPEGELPEVAAWRRVYARMGLKPTQYRSAAEALLRRFRREGTLPRLHPLVDLCNAVSLAFALPVAVFDLDRVDTFLVVRRARGEERYQGFGGEVEHPTPGEVIFADRSDNVHARRWTFRQSRLSTVGPATARVLIVSEGMHETAAIDVCSLVEALRGAIAAIWDEPGPARVLTAAAPRFEL